MLTRYVSRVYDHAFYVLCCSQNSEDVRVHAYDQNTTASTCQMMFNCNSLDKGFGGGTAAVCICSKGSILMNGSHEYQQSIADQYLSSCCQAQRLINTSTWLSYTMSECTRQTGQSKCMTHPMVASQMAEQEKPMAIKCELVCSASSMLTNKDSNEITRLTQCTLSVD